MNKTQKKLVADATKAIGGTLQIVTAEELPEILEANILRRDASKAREAAQKNEGQTLESVSTVAQKIFKTHLLLDDETLELADGETCNKLRADLKTIAEALSCNAQTLTNLLNDWLAMFDDADDAADDAAPVGPAVDGVELSETETELIRACRNSLAGIRPHEAKKIEALSPAEAAVKIAGRISNDAQKATRRRKMAADVHAHAATVA